MKTSEQIVRSLSLASLMLTLLLPDGLAQDLPGAGPTQPPKRTATDQKTEARFEIEIRNGNLLVEPLRKRIGAEEIGKLWGPGNVFGVPARLENIVKYLRAADPDLNIVLSSGAEQVLINELKLRSSVPSQVLEGISLASGGAVRVASFGAPNNFALTANRVVPRQENMVEVFNLGGYISTLASPADVEIEKKIQEVSDLITETYQTLHKGRPSEEAPKFRFHPGTRLFIVTGSSQAIDVARKVANALPGQRRPGQPELLDVPLPAKP